MVRRVLGRFLQLLLTGWGLITVLFVLVHSLPVNDAQATERLADRLETETSAEKIQQAQQAARLRLGLTKPVFYISYAPVSQHQMRPAARWRWNGTHNQYHQWLNGLLHGNFGRSYRTEEPVSTLLASALLVTLPLTGLAALLTIGLSVVLGLWLASRPGRRWLLTGLYALDSLPIFVVALLLLLLLANPDFLALFPTYGLGMQDDEASSIVYLLSQPAFLILPLASLVITALTEPTLQLVSALRHEAGLPYTQTARAKGLLEKQVLRRHALRNALLPIFTLFTELVPNLLAGAVVVELIFALPGLGRLLADAAATHDYPVVLGGILVVLAARLLTLALADWLYQLADPRLRIGIQ